MRLNGLCLALTVVSICLQPKTQAATAADRMKDEVLKALASATELRCVQPRRSNETGAGSGYIARRVKGTELQIQLINLLKKAEITAVAEPIEVIDGKLMTDDFVYLSVIEAGRESLFMTYAGGYCRFSGSRSWFTVFWGAEAIGPGGGDSIASLFSKGDPRADIARHDVNTENFEKFREFFDPTKNNR